MFLSSEIHLVELLHSGNCPPATHQRSGAGGLAGMSKARFDLLRQHIGDVNLEGRLQAAEAPSLRGFVWRTGFGIRERVAGAGPRRVERNASDDTMVWV